MSTFSKSIAAAILILAPSLAPAQTETHHPAEAPVKAQPMSPQMMQSMMQTMQNCMSMMQMMQGGMPHMQMQGAATGDMPMQPGMSEATSAYMAAMSAMDAPMMQGIQSADPDVAFVKGMIPHHQGAIDMAKAVLRHGKDAQVKTWAEQIIAAQEKEIAEMQEWLKAHGGQ